MRLRNGYPIRTVTQQEYLDGADQCLGFNQLQAGQQYTARLVRNRRKPEQLAVDYPVQVAEAKTVVLNWHEKHTVGFRPVSADGIVLPNIKYSFITPDGMMTASIGRLVLHRVGDIVGSTDGYFVGSDNFDDDWSDLVAAYSIGQTIQTSTDLALIH